MRGSAVDHDRITSLLNLGPYPRIMQTVFLYLFSGTLADFMPTANLFNIRRHAREPDITACTPAIVCWTALAHDIRPLITVPYQPIDVHRGFRAARKWDRPRAGTVRGKEAGDGAGMIVAGRMTWRRMSDAPRTCPMD